MASTRKRIEEGARLIAAGLAVITGDDAESVHDALKDQKANTKARETGDDDEAEEPKKRGRGRPVGSGKLKPPPDEDDDEKKSDDEDDEEKPSIPKDSVLDGLERTELKKIAAPYEVETAGRSREDIVTDLKALRDKAKKKEKAKVAEEEDEDEKPAKGKKAKAAEEEDDEEEPKKSASKDKGLEYPETLKEKKKDLEAWIKLNKEELTSRGFFGGKPKKGKQPLDINYEDLMSDPAEIKAAWKDNVSEYYDNKTWPKMKKKADAIEDDDDE